MPSPSPHGVRMDRGLLGTHLGHGPRAEAAGGWAPRPDTGLTRPPRLFLFSFSPGARCGGLRSHSWFLLHQGSKKVQAYF